MLDMDTLTWEEPLAHRMKVERNLNFATLPDADDEYGFSRKKTARDPMSHRIIEKRRRDRMNNCLADLSRLVPTNYLKKGRGRIEKTEIIEMAIKHLKHLQAHPCKDPGNCEVAKATEQDHKRQFRQGYQECMSETMKFMMELEGSWVVDGLGIRLVNHLQKHYDKLSGGICYTQALNMMASEESKPTVHMEVDNHSSSCFPAESNSNGGLHPEHNNHSVPYYENNRSSEAPPELKHEIEMNGHHASPTNVDNPSSKVTSQLREMLQNPGIPKDSSRCNGVSAPTSPHSQPMAVVINNPTTVNEPSKTEDGCYKFKNNIKHRFNNDLRHHTSSPTDSHLSDRMSLPDEDNAKLQMSESSPLRPCLPGEDRLNHNGGPPVLLCSNSSSHAFSPYQPSHAVSELSVKIPDRTAPPDNGTLPYGNQHWDSHAETASSCGSNPSPPPNTARSSGSSSGYSTNGENNSGSGKMKGAHSPALSPYSRTPDRLSNRSPSPCQPGVPIFALHPKGTFYIPLTIEASLLIPYMVGIDDMAPVLHPISICVNLSSHSVKVEKITNGNSLPYRPPVQSSYLMDKFHDRFVYSERHMFYPCPNSPAKNGCA